MADVNTTVHEDGSVSISLDLSPAESASLVTEASRAASVEPAPAPATPPQAVGAEAPTSPAEPKPAAEAPPVGPDTLTPTGEQATPPEQAPSEALPGSSGATEPPPAAPAQ